MAEIVPAPEGGGAFMVVAGVTEQSWVDPADPLRLEFEYVQRIAEALDATVLARPADERVRVVHIGGGGLTIPRYIAARRPHTAQIVLEPDADLIEQVRVRLPLPPHSGIKIRAVDGVSGLAAMPDDYADAIVLDAFSRAQVPGELVTAEFFDEVARVLRPQGLFTANVTDRAPITWTRQVMAGVLERWPQAALCAEVSVWKGRRFGNFVFFASRAPLPLAALDRAASRAAFPHRLLWGADLAAWVGSAHPFTSADAQPSPLPGRSWFD